MVLKPPPAPRAEAWPLLELLEGGTLAVPTHSSVSQPDRSQPRVYTQTPPPSINKSRDARPRPPEPSIGCLAGAAGCPATPLAPAVVHQRGPLSLFAICCFLFGAHVARPDRDRD